MTIRFHAFTQQAHNVLVLAKQEAIDLHYDYVGTEHLLIGLLGEHNGRAAEMLRAHSITLEQVRAAVGINKGRSVRSPRRLLRSARLSQILHLASNAARPRKPYRRYMPLRVDTEHLLLGLLLEHECVAVEVLERMGIELAILEVQVRRVVGWRNTMRFTQISSGDR